MIIDAGYVQAIVHSDEEKEKLYFTDHNFNYAINYLSRPGITERELVNLIFILCEGHRNTTNELARYVQHYGGHLLN